MGTTTISPRFTWEGARHLEGDDVGDVPGAQRFHLLEHVVKLCALLGALHVVGELALRESRLDCRDAHAPRSKLGPERSCQLCRTGLGCRVDGVGREYDVGTDRRREHQVAGHTGCGAREQVAAELARRDQQAAEVGVQHSVPLLDRRGLERSRQHDPGIGDHEVDPTKAVSDLAAHSSHGIRIGHIGDQRDGVVADLIGDRSDMIRASRDQGHTGALICKAPRGGSADPARSTGDHCHAVPQGEFDGCLGSALGVAHEPQGARAAAVQPEPGRSW